MTARAAPAAAPRTLRLLADLAVLRAVLVTETCIESGPYTVVNVCPIAALCRTLKAAGFADTGLAVHAPGGEMLALVGSIHESAWTPERLGRAPARGRR